MENSYGIGVRNRYELFYDEEVDPLDYLKQNETKKNKKDKSAEKENKGKTAKTKDSVPGKKTTKNEIGTKTTTEKAPQTETKDSGFQDSVYVKKNGNNKQPQKPRSNDRVKFSDREERNNRRNKPEEVRENRENRENGAPQRFDSEVRGGRGGRGGGFRGRGPRRGGRGGLGPAGDFRGKREFDRQSGMVTSGVKPVDKREGAGSFNWGSDKDQIEEQLQAEQNVDLDTSGESPEKTLELRTEDNRPQKYMGTITGNKPPAEEGTSAPLEDEPPKEDDGQREMTLDEWKALQKREKPIFKTRRAGEGENTAQWKKTYVLKKKIDDEESDEEEEEDDEEEVHHGRKKVLLPIDFQFADTPTRGRGRGRGRGGPGGRGRGAGGGRGRGGGRFQAVNRQEAPKMDDERDFPSLG